MRYNLGIDAENPGIFPIDKMAKSEEEMTGPDSAELWYSFRQNRFIKIENSMQDFQLTSKSQLQFGNPYCGKWEHDPKFTRNQSYRR